MKKILWLSPYAPYDQVAHAGGKVHNYYIKKFQDSGRFDVTLLSLCLKDEEAKLDLDQYGIKNHIFVSEQTAIAKYWRRLLNGLSYVNPFDKYAAVCQWYEVMQLKRLLRDYIKSGKSPDIVIMQWTFSVMLLPIIKKAFPDCKTVAIEEDVTFQSYYRIWKAKENVILKTFWRKRYQKEKKLELSLLEEVDMIVTNNQKDATMLKHCGLKEEKIFTSVSYFDNYSKIERNIIGKDILFYGAMARPENFESAIWFIKEVMPQLREQNVRFVIVGSNPPKELLKYQSERAIVTGFVKDVSSYLETCLCMAAPLIRGAGIKIKIIEGMSAGIPILTNEVGIEGISATDGEEYIHCETADDYAKAVQKIINQKINGRLMGEKARSFILNHYNIESKTNEFIKLVDEMTIKE